MAWWTWLLIVLAVLFLLALVYRVCIYTPLPVCAPNKPLLHFVTFYQAIFIRLPIFVLNWLDQLQYVHLPIAWNNKFVVAMAKLLPTNDNMCITDRMYDGVPVRVYTPGDELRRKAPVNGCIIFIHGGGWMMSDVLLYDVVLAQLVEHTGLHAVSISYRLAAGADRFPICLKDCERAVVHHLLVGASALNVLPEHSVLMGDSAGGNLCAILCHRLKKRSTLPRIKAAVLVYPAIQFVNVRLPSYLEEMRTGAGILPTNLMHLFHLNYFGIEMKQSVFEKIQRNEHVNDEVRQHKAYKYVQTSALPEHILNNAQHKDTQSPTHCDQQLASALRPFITHPDYSPMFNDDFTDHPPTAVITAGIDVLRDEGILYYERLKAEGVDVEWLHYEGAVHGVMNLNNAMAKRIIADAAQYLLKQII